MILKKTKLSKLKKPILLGLFLISAIIGGQLINHFSSSAINNFNPGNIMSDIVMSNKDTMTVAQIQQFLDSKNPCNNTNIHMAGWYPHLRYNIKDGKFVCMAKDSFNGESAAQIIWQAAQDYRINPQVLIVLLEKEQGLISDTWPNHVQYQTATGFGCPDTAACDSQYFGLKNQIRLAANLFRTVLDGGWSNYPVGEAYVQYNPNPACGGSVVNIQNRATSALYRYTPYQPNQAALNAGWGTAPCGAYGNRNFYRYFTSWFGKTIAEIPKSNVYLQNGKYTLSSALYPKSVLSVNSSNFVEAQDGMIQSWEIKRHDDGFYSVKDVNSGKALDVSGANNENGAKVITYQEHNGCNQRWSIQKVNDEYSLLSACSGKAIDLSVSKGSISMWENHGGKNQLWKMTNTSEGAIEDGIYVVNSGYDSLKRLAVRQTNNQNSPEVILSQMIQSWEIKRHDDGFYSVKDVNSGKALDVSGANNENGAKVITYQEHNGCNQRWSIQKVNDEYSLLSACSGKAIDLSVSKGSISMWENHGGKNQLWKIIDISEGAIESGTYIISSGHDSLKNLSAHQTNNRTSSEATTSRMNYSWELKRHEDGFYSIKDVSSGKVLDVSGSNNQNGAKVITYQEHSGCNQRWSIVKVDNEYLLLSACSGKALDLSINKGSISMWENHGGKNQLWKIKPSNN